MISYRSVWVGLGLPYVLPSWNLRLYVYYGDCVELQFDATTVTASGFKLHATTRAAISMGRGDIIQTSSKDKFYALKQ